MKDEFTDINVVPLVDIMLVLIVIVLMTANFMVHGMLPVRPPKSESEAAEVSESVLIAMTATGELYYEKEPLTPEALEERLAEVDKARPVLLHADRDCTLQPFVTLVDKLKKLGFTAINVRTER